MKILVTGGAGFIGAHLVKKLIDSNHKVLVIDSLKTIGGIKFVHPKCYFFKGNILNKNTLNKIKSWRPEIIYHLAAQSGGESAYDNPKDDFLSNGFGTFLLCKLGREIKIKKFIYTSSVAVYGSIPFKKINEESKVNPNSIYGISKFSGEMFVNQIFKNTLTQTIIFRLFNTYGPGENLNFLKKGMVSIYSSYIWKKKPIIVKGSLKRIRNFQYIDDVINILYSSLRNKKLSKNELFNVSNGQSVSVGKLIKLLLKINKLNNYKIIVSHETEGDSFAYSASNAYLKSKFRNLKFTSLKKGLNLYFKWIWKIPINKSLVNYHPFKIKSQKYK
jgi:UDP-glucose 4-epimerase